MRTCAYCGNNLDARSSATASRLTREHIVPDFIIKAETEPSSSLRYERGVITAAPMLIKDVCARCNNGVLADLDAYVHQHLWPEFVKPIAYSTKMLTYEFGKLSRWLLKLSYNSRRANDPQDARVTHDVAVVDYIMGRRLELPGLMLFANIVPDQKLTQAEKERVAQTGYHRPYLVSRGVRICHLKSPGERLPRLARIVSVNNFFFYLVYPVDTAPTVFDTRHYRLLNRGSHVRLPASEQKFIDTLEATFEKYPHMFP